jgi:hypothetical protein
MRTFFFLFMLSVFSFSRAQVTGPNAPEVNITYISSASPGFSFDLNNLTSSNNYYESYLEFDATIDSSAQDQFWRFQGYLIFQLLNDTIDIYETFDPNYSQLAAVVDISDAVTSINLILDACVSTPLVLENTGTMNNFIVSTDVFTSSPFIENEAYCFRVLAFATNPFSQDAICGISDYAVVGHTTGNGMSVPVNCVLASESAGLSEQDFGIIDISPNPTMGSLFIDSQSNTSSPYTVFIINELGQVVLERTFTERNIEVELPYSGVFMLRIESDGRYSQRKVIRL